MSASLAILAPLGAPPADGDALDAEVVAAELEVVEVAALEVDELDVVAPEPAAAGVVVVAAVEPLPQAVIKAAPATSPAPSAVRRVTLIIDEVAQGISQAQLVSDGRTLVWVIWWVLSTGRTAGPGRRMALGLSQKAVGLREPGQKPGVAPLGEVPHPARARYRSQPRWFNQLTVPELVGNC